MVGRPRKPEGQMAPSEQDRYDELIRVRNVAKLNLHHFKECYRDVCDELLAANPNAGRKKTCLKILSLLDRLDREIYQAAKDQNREFSELFLDIDED